MENQIIERLARIERYSLLAAKNVLNIDDVVLLTGYSKQHVYNLTCKNLIPYYKPNGKNMYFDRREVENWMKQNRHDTQEEAEQKAAAYMVRHSR